MKRTLLIPIDFDEYSPLIMNFCAGTRKRGIVKCVLMHVLDTSGLESPVISQTIDANYERLDELATPLRAEGIEVVTRVETGNRVHEIMRVAQREHADVIVMGTTKKSNLQRLFEGSVSAAVTWGQKAPTLLLRDDILANSENAKKLSLEWSKKLIVPVDFSESSARAVLQCTQFDKNAIGTVRLVHILTPGRLHSQEEINLSISEYMFRLSAFASMLKDSGIETETEVRIGEKRSDAILAEAEECGASGIVIGGGGRSSFTTFVMGSTSRAVLLGAPVPVMVVP